MGKCDGGEKKKGKGGHCHRYRYDNKIEYLRGLYKEPKYDDDNVREDDDNSGNWDDMDEKQREEDDDDDDDAVDITGVQFFGVTDEAFLGKDKDNKKKKGEKKSKGKDDESGINSGVGAKRGKKMKGVSTGPLSRVTTKTTRTCGTSTILK